MEFSHKPVMLQQCMDLLALRPDGIYVDGTAGGAGHSSRIAEHLETGRLIALDRDPDAVAVATERLARFGERAQVIHTDYADMVSALEPLALPHIDGVLMDLGVSSFQLDNAERGFSYQHDAPLDMRMSKAGMSAYDVVNTYPEDRLCRILWDYGEEKYTRKIVAAICRERAKQPIATTGQLMEIVRSAVPPQARRDSNPARQTFQAIRIEVNDELAHLQAGLEAAFSLLSPGGRLCVITFHSLEDRIVKNYFAGLQKGCTCPPDFPVCVCGNKPKAKVLTRKPVVADAAELEENPRSRSAKVRAIEKLAQE